MNKNCEITYRKAVIFYLVTQSFYGKIETYNNFNTLYCNYYKMNKVGLIVTINKYKTYFSSIQTSIVCDSIDDAYTELIKYIVAHLTPLYIDFPLELVDFENIWFNQTYVNADAFTYKLFHNNKWEEPWTQQEIYDDALEVMLAHENTNPPDFSKVFGEDAINDNTENNFTENNIKDKDIDIIESKMKEIMEAAKNNGLEHELTCNCESCK